MTRLAFRFFAWLWCRDIDRAARLARRARMREQAYWRMVERGAGLPEPVRKTLGIEDK